MDILKQLGVFAGLVVVISGVLYAMARVQTWMWFCGCAGALLLVLYVALWVLAGKILGYY